MSNIDYQKTQRICIIFVMLITLIWCYFHIPGMRDEVIKKRDIPIHLKFGENVSQIKNGYIPHLYSFIFGCIFGLIAIWGNFRVKQKSCSKKDFFQLNVCWIIIILFVIYATF